MIVQVEILMMLMEWYGVSQKDVCSVLKIDRSYLSKVLSGQVMPSLARYYEIKRTIFDLAGKPDVSI